MNVAELIAVFPDIVAETSLIQLHMVNIVQQFQPGRADQPADFRAHLRGHQEISRMICGNIQRLQIQIDLLPLAILAHASRVSYMAQSFTVCDRLS